MTNVRVHAGTRRQRRKRRADDPPGLARVPRGSRRRDRRRAISRDAQAEGQTIVGVAEGERLVGWITLADALRPNAAAAVAALAEPVSR